MFIGTGLFAWDRRPESNIGPLMTAVGFTWFFRPLMTSDEELPFVVGAIFNSVPFAVLIHLLLSFPPVGWRHVSRKGSSGSPTSLHPDAGCLGAVHRPETDGCEGCPENPLLIEGHSTLSGAISGIEVLLAITSIAFTVVLI